MTDYDDDSALDADIPDDDASAGGRRAPTHKWGEGGKPAKKKRARSINFGDLNRLLEHFALLYGTDTIWDGESRKIMKIGVWYDSVEETLQNLGLPPQRNDGHPGFLVWETDGKKVNAKTGSDSHPMAYCMVPPEAAKIAMEAVQAAKAKS